MSSFQNHGVTRNEDKTLTNEYLPCSILQPLQGHVSPGDCIDPKDNCKQYTNWPTLR